MIKRYLYNICFHPDFGRQMRFIAGPRQVGKTTLAKSLLEKKGDIVLFFNWDLREVRDAYKKDPYFFETTLYDTKTGNRKVWLCLDEIHKMPKWKNILKDYFDKFEQDAVFIVTGSAKLDFLRKSGDSLAGRYFLFKLLPVSLAELSSSKLLLPVSTRAGLTGKNALDYIEAKLSNSRYSQSYLDSMLNFSGFPEPLVKANKRFYRKWQQEMLERMVREDLRDLTKIVDLENIATLLRILPSKVGSLLSYNALRQELEVSYSAVKNYISALELVYGIFLIPPFSRRISRSIKKEKKCYFYDWTRCQDWSKRFENYAAVELKIMIELWNDYGTADFKLYFIRTKDGKETDFLITKDNSPWCLFEVKLKDAPLASHHLRHSELLDNIPVVQICHEDKVLKKQTNNFFRVSASRFFT